MTLMSLISFPVCPRGGPLATDWAWLADGEAAAPASGGGSPLRIAVMAGTIAVAHNVAAEVIWGLSATPRASATRPPKASNMSFLGLLSSVIENR